MIPQIKFIGGTQIDWNLFLQSCNEALGYSPIRGVDSLNRELSDPGKLLASLSAFHDRLKIGDPLAAIRDCGSLLRHLSYMFLVYCDKELILNIRERTQLNVTSSEAAGDGYVVIVSGSLFDYRTATLECCTVDAPFDLRYLFDGFILYFDSLGLSEIWHEYRKRPLKDKTFLLEYKP
jgi:hypothetical protein